MEVKQVASLFEKPIQTLKGVGEKRAESFRKLEVNSVGELIRFYPRTYEDWSSPVFISQLCPNEIHCIKAVVTSPIIERRISAGRLITKVVVSDESGKLNITFFNNRYIKNMLKQDSEYLFYGKVHLSLGALEMTSPEFMNSNADVSIRPIYRQTEGLSSRQIENAVKQALPLFAANIKEPLPKEMLEKYNLCSLEFAINNIHFPQDVKCAKIAKKRLVFEELLVLTLGLSMLKKGRALNTALKINKDYSDEFFSLLPFEPTIAQKRVTKDCIKDMTTGTSPMNRLVQGDVGSGKTAVAAAVCYTAIKNGWQAAFMAPTEILAEQHYSSLKKTLENTNIKIALLTGSQAQKVKREIKEQLASGQIDFVVGTHALISENVKFKELGLVVTDEQHRFGVAQRNKLVQKGNNPNLMIMSATPIPRTLALIIYGDLDVSIIDSMPPGRQVIDTLLIDSTKRERMYGFLKKHIDQGRQCYIVCPAVEENELTDIAAVEEYADKIKNGSFANYKVAVLHGKMKATQKEEVMRLFSQGEIQLLIATTVIEVGIDVPNSTVIAIENAERFGLSQLHQLRGRVGRGSEKSYCILISDAKNEETLQRLKAMCKTNSGFEIADADLKLRGPGDFFGSRQHGLPEMKIADLADMDNLELVQKAAKDILEENPELSLDKYKLLKGEIAMLFKRVGEGSFN